MFLSATSRQSQRGPHTQGAMMWSCLWTLQTTIWSAPYARGCSGVQLELHATTSFAKNASYSGWKGIGHNDIFGNEKKNEYVVLTMVINWIACILYRQETCPCCRKPVNPSLIFIMFKLSKSIGRMKIKVGNGNKEVDVLVLLWLHFFYICYRCSIGWKVLSYSLTFQWFITAQGKSGVTLYKGSRSWGLPKGVQFLVSFSLFSVSQHLCLLIVLLLLSKGDSFESAEI